MQLTFDPKNHYGSPRWSYEILDCSMPMTFDQHSRCSFECFYCFSQYQKAVGCAKANYISGEVRGVDIQKIKDIFTGKRNSQWLPLIKDRVTMQWGGLADPFCNVERDSGVGLELLKFFKEIDYPLCFSTKGTWWLKDKRYTDLFRGQKNWNVKVSIITLNEELRKLVEKGAPSSAERLDAIKRITDLNAGGATLRLRPFIIGVSSPDHCALIHKAAKAGATALSTEFFCLEGRSISLRKYLHKVSQAVGFDIYAFYKKYSVGQGYLRLCRDVKRPIVDEMEAQCKQDKVRFYVSDAHFKERCANGSCCGLPSDWNVAKGQLCEALQIAKKTGKVCWDDMAKHLDYAKKFLYRRTDGLNTCSALHRAKFYTMTLYDWMRWNWNNPNSGSSPYKMFEGILIPKGKDRDGNLIYVMDKTRL
jgi:DNA repair photolyase